MFGFLSQIPSFLGNHIGNVGRAIGSHIGNVGHTVGRHMGNVGQGVIKQARKPLDMLKIGGGGDGDGMMLPSAKMPVPAPTSVLTPGINPGARMPDIRLPEQAQSPLSIATMRPGRVGQVDMMSPAQSTPDALGINMSRNMPAVAPEVSMPTQVPMREMPQVRVPQLPGRTGPPLEDSPYNRARYEYVTRNMNEQGEIPRSWKTIGRSALTGIAKTYQQNPNAPWQAQLAGGAAGGIGAAINPAGGEEFVFDSMYAPGVEKDQQRSQEVEQRENERIRREQDVLMGKARIDDYEARRRAADEERPYRMRDLESQATLNEARAKAALQPRPVAPRYVQGVVDGQPGWYNVNDPELQGKILPYERPQREADEKPDDTWKSMNRDMQAFNKIKAEADEAMRSQYTEEGQAKLAQARAMAEQMKALYGDLIEVGESNGWPYAKPRQAAPRRGGSRPSSSSTGGTARLSDLKKHIYKADGK